MSWVVYSGLDKLPNSMTSDNVTEGCICLEGGAFRGLYTGGVLDALMENDINLRCTIGVSAGAMNGIGYATGQIGYASRINLGNRHNKKYVGFGARKNNGGIIGFDVAFNEPDGLPPIAMERIPKLGKRYVAVATNIETGKEEYFEADGTRKILKAIQASASMPYVSKPVEVDGKYYLDGGCACKIAYKWALEQGYKKIIIVRTRHKEFRKEVKNSSGFFTKMLYRKYPNLVERLIHDAEQYNKQCEEIEELEKCGKAYVIYPSSPITIGRIEKDVEKLGALYHMGYDDVLAHLDEIKEYLK